MKYFKTFNHINEKTQLVEKGSLLDIAWNVLTLGQGNKILASIKNAFSLSRYLIRVKHTKLRQILEKTMRDFDSEYTTNKNKVLKSVDLISKQLDNFIGDEEIESKDKIKELLLNYELENRITGFDDVTKSILDKIKEVVIKIKAEPEKSTLLFADLKQLIPQLNKNITEQRAKKRTSMLPAYLIKNLALDVANIINRNENEEKDKLRVTWEKGKNKIFQDYNKTFDVDVIDNWLNLSNYKVQKYDAKLDALYKKLPNTIQNLALNFKNDSFQVLKDEQLRFELNDEYVFKIKDFYIIMWCTEILDNYITAFIPIGVYKYTKENTFKLHKRNDTKYYNLNSDNILFYIPNLDSFIIEKLSISKQDTIKLWIHTELGENAKMNEVFIIQLNDPPSKSLIKEKIFNMLWIDEEVQIANLTTDASESISEIATKVKKFENLNLNIPQQWKNISSTTLKIIGWKPTMSNFEAKHTIKSK